MAKRLPEAPTALATRLVVTNRSGTLSSLVHRLNTARAVPTAARGTAPMRPMKAVPSREATGSAARAAKAYNLQSEPQQRR